MAYCQREGLVCDWMRMARSWDQVRAAEILVLEERGVRSVGGPINGEVVWGLGEGGTYKIRATDAAELGRDLDVVRLCDFRDRDGFEADVLLAVEADGVHGFGGHGPVRR